MNVDAAYVLALMLSVEPASPYRETFDKTADAIAKRSNASPLFAGEDGARKTAALVVAVGEFESRLQPNAEGDCSPRETTKQGTCVKGARGHSLCLLQIHESNLRGFDVSRDQILSDVDTCIRVGIEMMRTSFRVCSSRPLEERLSWYAAGADRCDAGEDAKKKSRHRMLKGRWLFEHTAHQRVSASALQGERLEGVSALQEEEKKP